MELKGSKTEANLWIAFAGVKVQRGRCRKRSALKSYKRDRRTCQGAGGQNKS